MSLSLLGWAGVGYTGIRNSWPIDAVDH